MVTIYLDTHQVDLLNFKRSYSSPYWMKRELIQISEVNELQFLLHSYINTANSFSMKYHIFHYIRPVSSYLLIISRSILLLGFTLPLATCPSVITGLLPSVGWC